MGNKRGIRAGLDDRKEVIEGSGRWGNKCINGKYDVKRRG